MDIITKMNVMGLVTSLIFSHVIYAGSDIHWQQLENLQKCDENGPLGMITGHIEDWQITASSTYPQEWDRGCHERYGRIYQPNGLGWCAKYKSASEWIQVDLGVAAKITGVMTQGRGDGEEWVTSFMVSHSMDAFHWQYVTDQYGNQRVFAGNIDAYSVKHSYLDEPVIARFVKFHVVLWNRHPSMRVEILGCQSCKQYIGLPPYGRVSASSEKNSDNGGACTAEDGFIMTNKGWCARRSDSSEWLMFDVGPPTLVTGIVTKGRGDSRKQWVTRFRISYSNDTSIWYFYKDASHLDAKTWTWNRNGNDSHSRFPDRNGPRGMEFGGNVDKDLERIHYLNKPFVARYIRFHPIDWYKKISMRAGLIGCPYKGECTGDFMSINEFTPCVENMAYQKESWINNRKTKSKRHVRPKWMHGHAARAVDGDYSRSLHSCTILDNFYVEKPVWMVDLGSRKQISGVMIITWQGDGVDRNGNQNEAEPQAISDPKSKYSDYMYNLDKLTIYVDSKAGKEDVAVRENLCGFVSRLNQALFKPRLNIQCERPMEGRYLYIEASGVPNRWSRLFSAVLCEVMVYQ